MLRLVNSPLSLGRTVRDVRRARGLTQGEAANLAGLAQPTVSKVERGASTASLDTILRLLGALQLELVLRDREPDDSAPWDRKA